MSRLTIGSGVGVIVPAAGLGTRLGALTRDLAKELLPLGGRPVIDGIRLELQAAGVTRTVVVTSPAKNSLDQHLSLWRDPRVQIVRQPWPLGVLDAVRRGCAVLRRDRIAVLFPDTVVLPDQEGLKRLLFAAERGLSDAVWFGLYRRDARRARVTGDSAAVRTTEVAPGVHRIDGFLGPREVRDGDLHTAFAQLGGATFWRSVENLGDDALVPSLEELARSGLLCGCELDVLDVGVRPGYDDACQRFDSGAVSWRA